MSNIRIGTSITAELAPLFRRVSRVHNKSLEAVELRAVEAHIFATLVDEGPLPVGEVQRRLGLSGSTLTGALDRLEKRELIKRTPSPTDRRSWVLEAVKIPARMRKGMEDALRAAEDACWGALTKAERAQLKKLLEKANHGLAAEEDK